MGRTHGHGIWPPNKSILRTRVANTDHMQRGKQDASRPQSKRISPYITVHYEKQVMSYRPLRDEFGVCVSITSFGVHRESRTYSYS